ncbi:MAG TPA: SDR family oxidoreductase [Thermoanaerobaculaceae bacterium]|nr:SDR family oxidoreductase [Thermoanaerobaculaceae bacterium]
MSGQVRVALVTGGAVRVGHGIVTELAAADWRVAFTYRASAAPARALVAELEGRGLNALAIQVDLDDAEARAALVARVRAELGALDALVNNAAVFPRTPFHDLSPARFSEVMRTNLEVPLFLAQAAAPYLRARGGSVVNIVDIYGTFPLRDHLAYSVSKAALIAATRCLALELAPEVRVNAVAPGIAIFPEGYDKATRARLLARTLLQREGGPSEIARAVRYLLEGSETMTGQVLTLDGGRTVAL